MAIRSRLYKYSRVIIPGQDPVPGIPDPVVGFGSDSTPQNPRPRNTQVPGLYDDPSTGTASHIVEPHPPTQKAHYVASHKCSKPEASNPLVEDPKE